MEIASLANKIVSNNENQTREMESGKLHEIVEYLSMYPFIFTTYIL